MAKSREARVALSESERERLEHWLRTRGGTHPLTLRARIVLACAQAERLSDSAVATQLRVSRPTVSKWRRRFAQQGIEGLVDAPRPGAPRSIGNDQVEQVILTTLEALPKGHRQWTTRLLAAELGMSQTAVSRIWRALALAFLGSKTSSLSLGAQFFAKVRDITGLYLGPAGRVLVLRMDTGAPRPAAGDSLPSLPKRVGQLERHVHDFIQRRTSDLMARLSHRTGASLRSMCSVPSGELAHFLAGVAQAASSETELHLVLDHATVRSNPHLLEWLKQHPRLPLHCAEDPSSWMRLLEYCFSLLTARQFQKGPLRSTGALESAIRVHVEGGNEDEKPFHWTGTAAKAPNPESVRAKKVFNADSKGKTPTFSIALKPIGRPPETALERARRHIAEGEARVARQTALLVRLASAGRDTAAAEVLLLRLRETLALMYCHLDHLEARSLNPDPPPAAQPPLPP